MFKPSKFLLKQEATEQMQAKVLKDKAYHEAIKAEEKIEEGRDLQAFMEMKKQSSRQQKISEQIALKKQIEQQKRNEIEHMQDNEEKKRQATLSEALRIHLQNCTPELQQLKRQLLMAKVTKEQSIQCAHKNAVKQLKSLEKAELAHKIACEKEKELEELKAQEYDEYLTKKKYHEALDQQLYDHECFTLAEKKKVQQERQIIDDMLKKILADDMEEERKRREEQQNFYQQILECQKAKEEMRYKESQIIAEEESKAEDYHLIQEYRTMKAKEKREMELKLKELLQNDLMTKLNEIYKERAELQELQIQLAIKEKELQDQYNEKLDILKQADIKRRNKEFVEKQLSLQCEKHKLDTKEDELLNLIVMNKLQEADEQTLLEEKRKKQIQQKYRQSIEDSIEERRLKIIADKEQQIAEHCKRKEIDEVRKKLIEEERLRILKENAKDLLGFLPKGTLTSERDVYFLGKDFQNFYLSEDSKTRYRK